MNMSNNPVISIIGFGRVGSHLYYSLKESGFKRIIKITRDSKDIYIKNAIKNSDIIFLCTKDSEIKNVVSELNSIVNQFNEKIIYHTSGALNSDLLIPLKRKGAIIGSFHPVQTFDNLTPKNSNSFKNIYIAIEGDTGAIKFGKSLALKLKAKSLFLSKENKIIHHICCVICSNYIVMLLAKIDEIWRKSLKISNNNSLSSKDKNVKINGFNKNKIFDIYKPLLMTTIQNVEKHGSIESLTGPIERNDLKTIDAHIKTLRKLFPESKPLFNILGIETVKLALRKGSISKSESKNIISKFGFLNNSK
jgi:predicted short-subunit dehydrogenase-like oxidoreductase (DUF2520 family)